jgi:Ankyrin repeats (3 copies)
MARLVWWYLIIGVLLMAGTAGLAARVIWEMTALSWERGPQMVGFALAHGHGPFSLLFFPPLLLVWLLIAALYLSWRFWKTRRVALLSLQAVISAGVLLLILALPQGFWIRLFIERFAEGPHAAEFMIDAAATGDVATVKALVAHGVPVDTRNREGKTALHGAALRGDVSAIAFLIDHGADVNAISLWGDSPLEGAASQGHQEAARYLESHGGKRFKGTEEQRKRAAEKIVREDIEMMDKRRP